jgi:hypothetical protein
VRARRTSRRHLGPRFSEGARQLWIVAIFERRLTQEGIRLALGKSGTFARGAPERSGTARGVVVRWLYGDQRAELDQAVMIEEVFGIPCKAWTLPAAEPFVVPDDLSTAPDDDASDTDTDLVTKSA